MKKASVFVLMPINHALLEGIYETGIVAACETAGALCKRIDKEVVAHRITDEIYRQISRADILIADVTGLNPNVYYEIGFAHGIGKNVVLLKHFNDESRFPFDTHDFQHIVYTSAEHLKEELKRRIIRLSEQPKLNEWNAPIIQEINQRFRPILYDGFTAASMPVENKIKPLLSEDKPALIRLMGMALHKSWPLISSLVEDNHLGKWSSPNLTIEMAVVSQAWLIEQEGLIHADWKDRLEIFENSILRFKDKARGQVVIKVHRFHHIPYIHGVLINDKHLFLGNCSWDRHNKFTAGANAYEEYSGDTHEGDRNIEQFTRWFNYCVKEDEHYSSRRETTGHGH